MCFPFEFISSGKTEERQSIMSVHGEYSRALEALVTSIRQLNTDGAAQWVTDLEAARISQHEDLSTAAKECLVALGRIEKSRELSSASRIGPDSDALREPYQRLLAHCRSVLGAPT
jgi:hypothetical protein